MYLEVMAVLHYNKHDNVVHAYVSKACVSSKEMYLRHQAYTLYYSHVCILVFLHVFPFSIVLRCMLKFMRLACGIDDVTQYNTANNCLLVPSQAIRTKQHLGNDLEWLVVFAIKNMYITFYCLHSKHEYSYHITSNQMCVHSVGCTVDGENNH